MPSQLRAVIDTSSTVLVSGSLNAEHHGLLAKIVPGLVWLLELYISRAAFVVGRVLPRLLFLLKNVL